MSLPASSSFPTPPVPSGAGIHVTVEETLGMAVAKPSAGACTVRRVGDAFVFNVLDHIGIKPRTISNA
jgi:hypothetical protein